MSEETTTTVSTNTLSQAELDALAAVRARFHHVGDQFSDEELARLVFLRWLYESERLVS